MIRRLYQRVFRRYTTRCNKVSPLNNVQCSLPMGHKGIHTTMPSRSLHELHMDPRDPT